MKGRLFSKAAWVALAMLGSGACSPRKGTHPTPESHSSGTADASRDQASVAKVREAGGPGKPASSLASPEDDAPRHVAPEAPPVRARPDLPSLPETIITVTYVRPGSMPDRLGVMRGDVLMGVNGSPIRKYRDSPFAPSGTNISRLTDARAERPATLSVMRASEELSLDVPVGATGSGWEMNVVFTENILPRVFSTPGVAAEQVRLVERSVHEAAELRWQSAARLAEEAVRAGLENADLLAYLGECYDHIPRYDEAEKNCRRALALNPQHSKALRALAYTLTFTGRPEEAVAMFDKLRPLHRFDKNDGRAERLARAQIPWAAAAKIDNRRLELGILPDLLNPRTPRRDVSVPALVPQFWPTIWGFSDNSFWTADIISNASLSAHFRNSDVRKTDRFFQYAGFWFRLKKNSFFFGISPAGDAIFKNAKGLCRVINLACVRPGLNGNKLRIVRQGSRFDCFVNGSRIVTYYQSDDPARLSWAVNRLGVTFADIRLEVPDRNAQPPEVLEQGDEVWMPKEDEYDEVEEDVF